jgi:hypothetical protein
MCRTDEKLIQNFGSADSEYIGLTVSYWSVLLNAASEVRVSFRRGIQRSAEQGLLSNVLVLTCKT